MLQRFCSSVLVVLVVSVVAPVVKATDYDSPFTAGNTLSGSDCVYSSSGLIKLCLRPDWTMLYLEYLGPGEEYTIWESLFDGSWPYGTGTHTSQTSTPSDGHANMQYDGNFVVLPVEENYTVWSTVTNDNSGAYLAVEDDGNFLIYSQYDVPLWSLF